MNTLNTCKLGLFTFIFASPKHDESMNTNETSRNKRLSDKHYRDSSQSEFALYSGFESECEFESWFDEDQKALLYKMSTEDNSALY
jgi:hypothetical protein